MRKKKYDKLRETMRQFYIRKSQDRSARAQRMRMVRAIRES